MDLIKSTKRSAVYIILYLAHKSIVFDLYSMNKRHLKIIFYKIEIQLFS